jgi:hypothetical protein
MSQVAIDQTIIATAFSVGLVALLLGLFIGSQLERRSQKQRRIQKDEADRAQALAAASQDAAARRQPPWMTGLQPQKGTAGWTIVASLNGVGCLGRSMADEPVFVLCARDRAASMAVRDWAALAEKIGAKPSKISGARALADRMEQWREQHGGGKIPD